MTEVRSTFPPSPRFTKWPLALLGAAGAGYAFYLFEPFEPLYDPQLRFDWDWIVLSFPVPLLLLAGAAFCLFLPLGRVRVEVAPDQLELHKANGAKSTTIAWQDVDRITRIRNPKRGDILTFQVRNAHGGKAPHKVQVSGDVFDGTIDDVIHAIRARAPQGGYCLEEVTEDSLVGAKTWWKLVPTDADA